MIAQRTFKKHYAETLADNVRQGYGLDLYAKEEFPYDPEEVVIIPTLRYPEGLKDKMIPTSQADCESAIALYEAYPNLTPLQASDKAFWVYLSHVDLFEYVQKRYPKVKEEGFDNINYVMNRWFPIGDWIKLHPLASLWWYVFLTYDENSVDPYKYTRVFFSTYEFRTNFVQYSIARHKEAVIGYFDFLIENEEVMSQYFKARNRFITKYLNKLGGSKLLSSLPREYFTEELTRIKPQILAVTSTSKEDDFEEEYEEEYEGVYEGVYEEKLDDFVAEKNADSGQLFYIRTVGCNVTGKLLDNNRIVILKGSVLRKEVTNTFKGKEIRNRIISEYCTATEEGYECNKDLPPMSPSGASGLAQGRSSNGKRDWKNENGEQLAGYLK